VRVRRANAGAADTEKKMMCGLIRRNSRRRQRASARRHFHDGCRAAAARAFTAAEIYLDKRVPSLAAAAMHCGSNVRYVQAAIVLIQDETAYPQRMRQLVLEGRVPLLAAAHAARQLASWRCWMKLRAEYRRSAEIWDDAIVSALGEERGDLARAVAAE
jgi:hypothetical protein